MSNHALAPMSDEALTAIVAALGDEAFHIGLRRNQMVSLLVCLRIAFEVGDEETADFASDLAAGIAAALGVVTA